MIVSIMFIILPIIFIATLVLLFKRRHSIRKNYFLISIAATCAVLLILSVYERIHFCLDFNPGGFPPQYDCLYTGVKGL